MSFKCSFDYIFTLGLGFALLLGDKINAFKT